MTLVEALVFLIPFRAISFDIGLAVSPARLLSLIVLLLLIIFRNKRLFFNKWMILFILYASLSTIIISNFYMEFISLKHGNNYFRQDGRYIAQIFLQVLIVFGLLISVSNAIQSKNEMVRLFKVLLDSITLLAFLGLLQFIVYRMSGVDLFPIQRFADVVAEGKIRTALYQGVTGWVRVCSYGGEPKGFAAIVGVGITQLFMVSKFKMMKVKYLNARIVLYFLVVVLSASTGGILLMLVLSVVSLFMGWGLKNINWNLFRAKIIIPFLAVGLFIVKYAEQIAFFMQERIINRISSSTGEEGGIEDYDVTIIAFLKDQPRWSFFGAGWGNIHNLVQDYIPQEYFYYMNRNVIVAKSGYLRLISDTGFFGFGLYLIFVFSVWISLWRNRNKDIWVKPLLIVSITFFLGYMMRSIYSVYEFMIMMGIAIGYLRLVRQNHPSVL